MGYGSGKFYYLGIGVHGCAMCARGISIVPDFDIGCLRGLKVLETFSWCQDFGIGCVRGLKVLEPFPRCQDFGIGCVRGLKVLEPFPRCQTLALGACVG